MYDDELKGAQRLRYWMYRALGKSDTQARWQLRQSSKSQPSKRVHRHRHCDQCNQLLLLSDAQCHRCGATQVAPSWLLQLSRSVKVEPETVIPIIVGTCLLGYLVQVSMGCSLFGGLASAPPIIQVQVLDVGAIKPRPLEAYLSLEEAWRLFTYTCVHGNLWHIAFNMIALLQIGPLVARTFGFTRTLFIWVLSGALAVILPGLLFPIGHVVGASGSVFGLIGVAMAYGHRVGTAQGRFIRNKMIEWTVFCTLFGFAMGGVAHGAHFGGLIAGGALSFILPPPQTTRQRALSPLLLICAVCFMVWSLWSAALRY